MHVFCSYKYVQEEFSTLSEDERCEIARRIILMIDTAARTDYAIGLTQSNMFELVYLVRQYVLHKDESTVVDIAKLPLLVFGN